MRRVVNVHLRSFQVALVHFDGAFVLLHGRLLGRQGLLRNGFLCVDHLVAIEIDVRVFQ